MKAVALQSTSQSAPARKQLRPVAHPAPVPPLFFQTISGTELPIQRKADCPCGGGCPRCGSKSENLSVSQPNDPAEIEADRMADKVAQRLSLSSATTPSPPLTAFNSFVQRKYTECEENQIQKKADGDSHHPMQNIESRLDATKGLGTPLPNDTKRQMESAFGTDFSGVRVHTGREAVQLSRALNAHAFTHGSDVYFNDGKYNPSSAEGARLLAHELAHTVQQNKNKKTLQRQEATGGCGVCRDEEGKDRFLNIGNEAHRIIQQQFETDHLIKGHLLTSTEETIRDSKGADRRIDLVYQYKNKKKLAIGEIKPPLGNAEGLAQLKLYKEILRKKYPTFEIENLRVSIDDKYLVFPNPNAIRCPEQFLEVKPSAAGVYTYECKPPWSVLKDECKCKKAPPDTIICGVKDAGEIDKFLTNAQQAALKQLDKTLQSEVNKFVDKLAILAASEIAGLLPFEIPPFEEVIKKQLNRQIKVLAYELTERVKNNIRRIIANIVTTLCATVAVVSLQQVLEALKKRMQEFILGEAVDLVLKAADAALKALAEAVIVAALAVIVIALLPEAIAGLGASSLYTGSVAALKSLGPALTARALELVFE